MLENIKQQARKARAVATILAGMSTIKKNELLNAMAEKLELQTEYILQENARDLEQASLFSTGYPYRRDAMTLKFRHEETSHEA